MTYSVDGLSDSDALEYSRGVDTKTQNYWDSFHESPPDAEYSAGGMKVADIFMSMLRKNSMRSLYYKDQVAPFDSIHEEFSDAWATVISELELDEEASYNPSARVMGCDIEFRL